MRSISAQNVALAAGCLLGATNAISLVQPRDAAPRVVSQTIYRREITDVLARDRRRIARRQSKTVGVDLANEETLYFMNVSIGTPAQDLRLHIDTGSSDLWVNSPTSSLCESSGNPCSASGTYVANQSSTYKYVNDHFNISYVDGSGSSGDYVTDVVRFGDVSLSPQQFGIGYQSTSMEGILGIGYPLNEVAVAYFGDQPYANVPKNLVEQGHINSNAYSLWLNDLDASEGSILFGGVNTGKYKGDLVTVPVIQEQGVYAEFYIALTGLGLNGDAGSIAKDVAIPVLLDSGSSLMYLPDDMANDVFQATGARWDEKYQAAFIDCNKAYEDTTIDFTFSDPVISVSMSELVLVAAISTTGQEICILGVAPAGDINPVLGDTFLRSAYVVYDLANNEIGLAQTSFNSTTDNIMEISSSGTIPEASEAPDAVSTTSYQATGGSRLSGIPDVSSEGAAPMQTPPPMLNMAYAGAIGAAGLMYVL